MLRPGESYDIHQLLPHGPGMRLIDRLVGYDGESVTCGVTIRRDSPFCDGPGVPAWIGLEYMAQAVAAFTGIERLQQGRDVQVGLLLGSRAFSAAIPAFPVGAGLTVRAELTLRGPGGVGLYDCAIRDGDAPVAQGEIRGYQPDDIGPYLAELRAEMAAR